MPAAADAKNAKGTKKRKFAFFALACAAFQLLLSLFTNNAGALNFSAEGMGDLVQPMSQPMAKSAQSARMLSVVAVIGKEKHVMHVKGLCLRSAISPAVSVSREARFRDFRGDYSFAKFCSARGTGKMPVPPRDGNMI